MPTNADACRRTRTRTLIRILATKVDQAVDVEEATATKTLFEEHGDVAAMTDRTATKYAVTVGTPLRTTGMTVAFTDRSRKMATHAMFMLHRLVPTSNHNACCIQFPKFGQKANIESFGLVDDGQNVLLASDRAPLRQGPEIARQAVVVAVKTALSSGIYRDRSRFPINSEDWKRIAPL